MDESNCMPPRNTSNMIYRDIEYTYRYRIFFPHILVIYGYQLTPLTFHNFYWAHVNLLLLLKLKTTSRLIMFEISYGVPLHRILFRIINLILWNGLFSDWVLAWTTGVRFSAAVGIGIFFMAPRPALWPTQAPIQWLRVTIPEHKAVGTWSWQLIILLEDKLYME
jgi:hypothetical protein